jgi:hypothetical protein
MNILSETDAYRLCHASNLVMAAMFDPDVAKTCPAATVLYDGDRHLLTVTINGKATGITPTQVGIEQATAIVANAMEQH